MKISGRLCVLSLVLLVGCELDEITVVDVDAVVMAEVYVDVEADPANSRVRAFLHWTVGTGRSDLELLASTVTITRSDGLTLALTPTQFDECIATDTPGEDAGICFSASPADAQDLEPDDLLDLRIDLPDGGAIVGTTRVPGAFELLGIPPVCRLEPDALMPLVWSRSEGAWAYLNEASIHGLPQALEPEGIFVEDDPLYLFGLSISESDTTIVFPSEFGVFNRFTLDQELSVRLQEGLPAVTRAEVTITAIDRNFVNWARGGNFNPSGQVRVPSVSGGGTGVFGSSVVRRFDVMATNDLSTGIPDCPIEGVP
jgi:hypothetical protein